jgi:hypothetical protein
MNPYVSQTERENLIRLLVVQPILQEIIKVYAGQDGTDKKFIGDLRHARTRMDKAIDARRSFLDPDADERLRKSVGRLQLLFMPTPEAKKAHKEMLELKSNFPMDVSDFGDWYSFVIETTCKTCIRTEYEECPARRVLAKYDVHAIDSGATNKCQYSYVGTPEAETLAAEIDAETVPTEKYNQAVAELNVMTERFEQSVQRCSELEQRLEESKAPSQELIELSERYKELATDFDSLTVKVKSEYLPEFERQRARIAEMEEVNATVIMAVAAHETAKEKMVEAMAKLFKQPVSAPQPVREEKKIPDPVISPIQQYKIECKCGASYHCRMSGGRENANCRTCNAVVHAAPEEKRHNPFGEGSVIVLTNRIRSAQENKPVMKSRWPEPTRRLGTTYQEPIGI